MIPATRIGGSSAERILNCYGSPRLCAAAPPEEETAFAGEGTVAHKLGEVCLVNGFNAEDLVGRFIDVDGQQCEVTPEHAEVQAYVDHVRKHFCDKHGQTDLVRASTLRIEQLVSLEFFDPQLAGTCDCWVYDPDTLTLHVFDYKHGMGVPVEIENNPQLKFYGLGAMLALDYGITHVVLHVVQPRCEHPDGPVRSWPTTPEALLAFGFELQAALEESRKPDAPLKAGEKWCQFCAARFTCPALKAIADEAADCEQYDALLAATGGALDSDELGKRMGLLDTLSVWINATRRYGWSEAQRGRIPTGHKLVRIRGRMRFKDTPAALKHAAERFKLPPDKLFKGDDFKRSPLTPRQLQKLIKPDRAAEFEEFLAEYTTTNKSLALVPLSDKREAVEPDVLTDFADLFEEESNVEADA
jgi:hypothetical protein